MIAVGVVAAGKIHCGFVKPGMSVTFGPSDLKTKVSIQGNCKKSLSNNETVIKLCTNSYIHPECVKQQASPIQGDTSILSVLLLLNLISYTLIDTSLCQLRHFIHF